MNFYIRQSFLLFTSTAIAICNVIDNYGCSCACVTVAILSCKHVKIHYAFTPLKRRLSNCPSQIFYVLKQHQSFFCRTKFIRNFHVPSYDFYLQSFLNFQCSSWPKDKESRCFENNARKKVLLKYFYIFQLFL